MAQIFVPTDDGRWVSSEFERLARLVNEYDNHLELRWIPPEHRSREDKKPYCVWDKVSNTPVLFASELDSPVDILARLYTADSNNSEGGSALDRLEAYNLAIMVTQLSKWNDEREEMREQAEFLLSTPLHWVKFNGKKLDDTRRPVT